MSESAGAAPLVPQAHGGSLRRGGTVVGGLSEKRKRTQKEALALLQDVLTSPKCRAAVRRILSDASHKHFPAIYTDAMNRVFGKPTESVKLSGSVGAIIEHTPLSILLPPLDAAPAPAPWTNEAPRQVLSAPAPSNGAIRFALPDLTLGPDVSHEDDL